MRPDARQVCASRLRFVLGPTPKSGGAIRRLADANDAFVAAAIRPRSNLAILIYCIPANVQPSHCGLLCIDEVRKERSHGNPDVSSNSAYIERDRAFSRVFAAWLLGFEGTPCVSSFRASNISKLFRPLDKSSLSELPFFVRC